MAEEDLIFGKNRHLFGGIEPSNMRTFTAAVYAGKVRLNCQLPLETTINGQTLCTVAGAVIRRSTTGYPKDEFDGDLVADVKASGYVIDKDASIDSTYYYAAFPYTGQGVYNRSTNNRTAYSKMTDAYLFGYDLDLTDSNPSTRVSYPAEVMNYGYTPAKMDYTTGAFSYGGWPSTHGINFMPRPCILKFDGTVLQYLDPNDYTKQYNSTSSSSIATPSSGGNVMMEWPKIYIHREVSNGKYKFRCSNIKYDSDWDCWCNYDVNNNVIDHFYTGVYPGIMNTGNYTNQLRSISGFNIQSAYDHGQGTYYYGYYNSCAYANNPSDKNIWDVEVLADRILIQDLLVMMARSTDCTAAYGVGASRNSVAATGTMNAKGLFYGTNTASGGVKVFGMEHWWGNRHRLMNGLAATYTTNVSGNMYFKITKGTHDGSTTSSYTSSNTTDYSNYKSVGEYDFGYGHIDSMEFVSPYGRLYPNSFNGSSSTYEHDMASISLSNSQNLTNAKVAYVGMYTSGSAIYGPFSIDFDDSMSYKGTSQQFTQLNGEYTCAALSCKPIKS